MKITKQQGNFYDIPTDQQWWCRFDVLALPADHRKILNRQPITKRITLNNGLHVIAIIIDRNIISN